MLARMCSRFQFKCENNIKHLLVKVFKPTELVDCTTDYRNYISKRFFWNSLESFSIYQYTDSDLPHENTELLTKLKIDHTLKTIIC